VASDSEVYYRFPTHEASDEYITEFARRHFAEYFTYRTRHMERIARNIYYEIGRQWVERDLRQLAEGSRGYAFRDMRDTNVELPRPVTNYITPAVDVEFATLSKRQWTPKIPTFSRDPRREAAAKVANEILNDRLKKLYWEDLRDTFIRNLIVHGTAIVKSFWNESYQETSWVIAENPYVCQNCGAVLQSNMANAEQIRGVESGQVIETASESPEDLRMESCPRCEGPIVPYGELSEARSRGTDVFGRPMGEEVPKGNTDIELVTPFEYYPQNHGIGVSTLTATQHGICKIRSLDWVEDHFPDLVDKVEPERPEVLLREHPLLGEWDITERFDLALDAGIFDHHLRVYELYREPSRSDPKGRLIVMLNRNQALLARNEELMAEIEDEDFGTAMVPKAMIAGAIWKPREGEYWGRGLPDDLISPQNRVNGIDAQIIEARERMGSPNLLIPEDSSLEGPEYRTGYGAGKFFTYRLSALNPNAKPEVFGSILMPAGVNNERTQAEQDITKIIGPADIEIGEAPRNITTTSGLQILGEQAERRRGTRERGITSVFKKVWEHQLQMLWVLRIDEDEFEQVNPDGTWEMKQYNRSHIEGHTKVDIEKQAYIDRSVVQREAAREAQMDQLYDISSPIARKKLLELRGLPTDVNEDTSLQIEHARRDWAGFVDDGVVPVVDKSIHNHMIRFQVFGTMLLQDEGQWIGESAYWNQILPALAGWEDELQMLAQRDAEVRAFYGGEPPPEQAQEKYALAMTGWAEEKAQYDKITEERKRVMENTPPPMPGMPPPEPLPPQGPPPPKPPPPKFIPRQPEIRIMIVWDQMIQAKGGLGKFITQEAVGSMDQPDKLAGRIRTYMKFRAVVEAHRLLAGPGAGPAPGSSPAPPGEPPVGPMPPQPGAANGGPPPTPETPPAPATPPAP
jgi:hypothetical protein